MYASVKLILNILRAFRHKAFDVLSTRSNTKERASFTAKLSCLFRFFSHETRYNRATAWPTNGLISIDHPNEAPRPTDIQHLS